ncbi:MAG: hypothetical protein ACLFUG_11420 [Nitriliruptoraceae bacterium]
MIRNLTLDVYYVGRDEPVRTVATAPDIIRWERATDSQVSDLARGAALDDLAHLAYFSLKRTGRTDQAKLDGWLAEVEWIEPVLEEAADPTRPGR